MIAIWNGRLAAAFDDHRVRLEFEDGAEWVGNAVRKRKRFSAADEKLSLICEKTCILHVFAQSDALQLECKECD